MSKHALVIEGGGMKAAYANGVLTAFHEADHREFAAIYGTSAGGALAAWFAAGQAKYAEATWPYAADRRVVSYRRFMTGRGPLLDHDFLLDVVYAQEHPMDVEALRRFPAPVYVTASDVQSGLAHYEDVRRPDALQWLKATGRLPLASGKPVTIGDRTFLDGGIADPIPIRRAIDDGHDRITLILNTPPGPIRPDNSAVAKFTARRYPALREGLLQHTQRKEAAIELALRPPGGVRVDVIRPAARLGLHRLTRDLARLRAAIARGHIDGREHLARAKPS